MQTNQENRWLDVQDYIRMYALQLHLKEAWDKVADNLLLVYGGDQKNIYEQSIKSSIEKWGVSSSKQMWLAIDRYLANNNINLDMFNTKEGRACINPMMPYLVALGPMQDGKRGKPETSEASEIARLKAELAEARACLAE